MRLVDQDVVDAAVELVEHPRRNAGLVQQIPRLEDEILVVEQRVPLLAALVLLQKLGGERQQAGRRLVDLCLAQAVDHNTNASRFVLHHAEKVRVVFERLRQELLPRLAFFGEVDVAVGRKCVGALRRGGAYPRLDALGTLHERLGRLAQLAAQMGKAQRVEGAVGTSIAQDRIRALALGEA